MADIASKPEPAKATPKPAAPAKTEKATPEPVKPVVSGGEAGRLARMEEYYKRDGSFKNYYKTDEYKEYSKKFNKMVDEMAEENDGGKFARAKNYMSKDWQKTKEIFPQRVETGKRFFGRGASYISSFGFPRAEMVLVLLGMGKFFLEIFGYVDKTGYTAIVLSTILLGFFSLFVIRGEGFVLAIGVVIYLNRYSFPFNPEFLRIGIPLFIIGGFLFGIKSLLGPRLLPAVLIYFYDIGAYDFLISSFGLTVPETMGYYIRVMPWWIILGLAYIDAEQYRHRAGAIFMKAVGVGIIFLTVMGNIIPSIGHAQQIPALEQFQQARAQVEAQLPKGEHIVLSQLACIQNVAQPGALSMEECVKRRQAESRCKPLEKTDLEAHEECMKVARGEKQDSRVIGTIDEAQREPTSFTINKGDKLDKINNDDAVPFVLDVKNPRKQQLEFDITCTYEAGNQKIDGLPIHTSVVEESRAFAFNCRSSQPLPSGQGKWVVKTTAYGLTTTVGLHRFFVGDQKQLLEDVAQNFFGTSYAQAISSAAAHPRGPPDSVRLDFIVGQPPQNPIIETVDPQLIATVKNSGSGELLRISRAHLAMDAQHFTPGPECKLQQQGEFFVNPELTTIGREKVQEFRFALCDLMMDDEYRFPKLPVHRYFISTITYDYRITKEFLITVYQPTESVASASEVRP